jgi:hypothetical protein
MPYADARRAPAVLVSGERRNTIIPSRRTKFMARPLLGQVFRQGDRPMDERQTIIVFASAVGFLVLSVFMLNVVGLS